MIGENILLDFAGFIGVSLWTKTPIKCWRALVATVFGVAGGVSCFFLIHSFLIYLGVVFLLVNPFMLFIGFGRKPAREMGELYVTCLILHLLLGGVLNFLEQMMPEKSYGVVLVVACLTLLGSIGVLQFFREKKNTLVEMSVLIGNVVKQGIAYRDTGNCLRDSVTNMAVCIVPDSWMKEAGISRESLRNIPFETISGEDRIYIYPVTNFFLREKDEMQMQKKMMIGFANDALFSGKEYQMILHKDFC